MEDCQALIIVSGFLQCGGNSQREVRNSLKCTLINLSANSVDQHCMGNLAIIDTQGLTPEPLNLEWENEKTFSCSVLKQLIYFKHSFHKVAN
jgi:hypothetical protein